MSGYILTPEQYIAQQIDRVERVTGMKCTPALFRDTLKEVLKERVQHSIRDGFRGNVSNDFLLLCLEEITRQAGDNTDAMPTRIDPDAAPAPQGCPKSKNLPRMNPRRNIREFSRKEMLYPDE